MARVTELPPPPGGTCTCRKHICMYTRSTPRTPNSACTEQQLPQRCNPQEHSCWEPTSQFKMFTGVSILRLNKGVFESPHRNQSPILIPLCLGPGSRGGASTRLPVPTWFPVISSRFSREVPALRPCHPVCHRAVREGGSYPSSSLTYRHL